jgi:hypothetical protein
MKKSELKEIIKASFLEEAKDYKKEDDVKEAMRGDMEEDDVKEAMRGDMEEDDVKEAMRGSYMEEDDIKEQEDVDVEDDVDVDVKDEEDIDVDVEKDVKVDDKETESDISIKTSVPGESEDVEAVQGLLTKAQSEAEKLGDEKLMAQIGNTITYFTRKHVVKVDEDLESGQYGAPIDAKLDVTKGDSDVAGVLGAEAALNLQEVERFKKLAGLIK